MAHLDFREALSTPEQRILSAPVAVPVAQAQLPAPAYYFPEVGLSRSTWANIVFVAIAAIGGMACAFYFFNGSELLRAAASWPAEFLYPRPILTQSMEADLQPTAVDQYASDSGATATRNDEARSSSDENFRPNQLAQFPTTTDLASTPTTPTSVPPASAPIVPAGPPGVPPVVPPVSQPIIPPVIPPVLPPGVPQPDSILGDAQKLVAGADSLAQSVDQTADQTVTSVVSKKVVAASTRSTVTSVRKKVATTRQKASARASSVTSTLRGTQSLTSPQSSGVVNQTMFGGGMGAVSGIGSIGSAGSAGSSSPGAGSPGGVTGPGVGGPGLGGVGGIGGVGGVGGVGGLPGVGGISGGLPGVGGIIGGHH